MPKLSIKLIQHSPLIHFQSHLENPGIRVTELRPKLDKYLLNKCPELLESDVVLKGPVNPNNNQDPQTKSLRYKLRCLVTSSQTIEMNRDAYPCFFGNTGVEDEREKKKLLYFPKGLILEIHSDYNKLIECIEKHISEFFIKHSFGNRTSKGFGCFTVSEVQEEGNSNPQKIQIRDSDFELVLQNWITTPVILKKVIARNDSGNSDPYSKIFREIDNSYKKIKSGPPIGGKSLVRQLYLEMKPSIEWEKPILQDMIEKVTGVFQKVDSYSGEKRFVRAFLGLPGQYEFRSKRRGKEYEKTIYVSHKTEARPSDTTNEIQRFPSPLCFKVFNNIIYLFKGNDTKEERMCNIPFNFKLEDIKKQEKTIYTPSSPPDYSKLLFKLMGSDKNWQKL